MLDRLDFLTGAFDHPKEKLPGRALRRIDEDGLYHSPNICFATDTPILQDGAQTTAGTDLSGVTTTLEGWQGSGQFLAVILTGARTVGLPTASTNAIYGVLQNKPAAGQAADVALEGVCKAMSGGVINAAAAVMATSNGDFVAWTSGSGYTLVGYAVEAAVDEQIFTLRLRITPVIT